jgi:hypothetical protein
MFAMDHAATALALARRYPRVPMPALLVSVQLMELVWVALNLVGIERSTTDPSVHTVAGIHLSYMPYSHSVATMLGAALLAAGVLWTVTRRRDLAAAIGLGIGSHLMLDLLVHAPDLALAPGVPTPKLGLGLYFGRRWFRSTVLYVRRPGPQALLGARQLAAEVHRVIEPRQDSPLDRGRGDGTRGSPFDDQVEDAFLSIVLEDESAGPVREDDEKAGGI